MATLLAATTLLAAPGTASGVRAAATAIIREGVAIHAPRNELAPPAALTRVAAPKIRIVERPCDQEAAATKRLCKMVLIELQ